MAKISKAVKKALLSMAHSKSLRRDFEAMRKNRALRLKNNPPTLDDYIQFATFVNTFANHAPKKFVKMEGNNFKL